MRIGIYTEYLDLKDDIIELISAICQIHTVILFISPHQKNRAKQIANVSEIRLIENEKISIVYRLYNKLLESFLLLPKNKSSIKLSKSRVILSKRGGKLVKKLRLLNLQLAMMMPRFLSYDKFIKYGIGKLHNQIDDLDAFICFTPFANNQLIRKLYFNQNIKKYAYVHSWDHPYKFNKFPKKYFNYLVWNKSMKADLINQQGIDQDAIRIVGCSQFSEILRFLQTSNTPENSSKFIYYPCFAGYEQMVKLEIEALKWLSLNVKRIDLKLQIVIRPYPQVFNPLVYEEYLGKYANIKIESLHSNSNDASRFVKNISEKYEHLKNALLVIHSGTTVGLETCYFDTPSMLLDIDGLTTNGEFLSFDQASSQAHVNKHIKKKYPANVIRNHQDLALAIQRPDKYLSFNNEYRVETPLLCYSSIAEKLIND